MLWSRLILAGLMVALFQPAADLSGSDGTPSQPSQSRGDTGLWLTQVAKLTASDASAGDRFGALSSSRSALVGDTLVVGSIGDDNAAGGDAGSAYLFTRSAGAWVEQQWIIGSDVGAGDAFGSATAVSADTVVVSATWHDHSGFEDAGAVYVFDRVPGGVVQSQKLTASVPAEDDWFGFGLDMDADTLAVGPGFLASDCAVEVFTRSGGAWSLQQRLTASDATPGDVFGYAVAISGDELVVGAPLARYAGGLQERGAAYVFRRSGATWAEQEVLTAGAAGRVGDHFGASIALAGDWLLIGAPATDRTDLPDSGTVYAFRRVAGEWTEAQILTASDGAAEDYFGDSVVVVGDVALVSALHHDPGGITDAGAVYVFARSESSWVERKKCTADDAAEGDLFGLGFSVSGDTVLIGAALDDHSSLADAGAVYEFRLVMFADGFESAGTAAWSITVP